MNTNQPLKKAMRLTRQLSAILLVPALITSTFSIAEANASKCKIKVVGGSYKGRSFPLKMKNGQFSGQSGVSASNLEGCRVKKIVYGRWYHLCEKGTLIVYKRKNNAWKRLKPKSLLKYQHTCF